MSNSVLFTEKCLFLLLQGFPHPPICQHGFPQDSGHLLLRVPNVGLGDQKTFVLKETCNFTVTLLKSVLWLRSFQRH